jgi:hypothetical protein
VNPAGYDRVAAAKMLVWITPAPGPNQQFLNAWSRWLDDLPAR